MVSHDHHLLLSVWHLCTHCSGHDLHQLLCLFEISWRTSANELL